MNNSNYYDLLGVRPSASFDEIRAAYHTAIRHYHPDVNKAPNAGQITTMLNQAWNTLRDPSARAQYDREIVRRTQPTNPVRPATPSPEWTDPRWWQRGPSSGGYSQRPPHWDAYAQQRAQWSGVYAGRRTTVREPDFFDALAGRMLGRTVRVVAIVALGIAAITAFTHLLPFVFPIAIGFFVLRAIACNIR